MKPCDNCIEVRGAYGCCITFYDCFKYKNWIKERVEHERHADPQEPEEPLNFHDDDREV